MVFLIGDELFTEGIFGRGLKIIRVFALYTGINIPSPNLSTSKYPLPD